MITAPVEAETPWTSVLTRILYSPAGAGRRFQAAKIPPVDILPTTPLRLSPLALVPERCCVYTFSNSLINVEKRLGLPPTIIASAPPLLVIRYLYRLF
jgi:hypothetical protein